MNNYLKIFLLTIISMFCLIGKSYGQTTDTVVIAHIENGISEFVLNEDIIKNTLANLHGSGVIDSLAIMNINMNFYIIGFGHDDENNYVICHKLIHADNNLKHTNFIVVDVHSCIARGKCSHCLLVSDAAGNITGCNCSSTTPPTSSAYCDHKIEQIPVGYQ